MMQCIVFSICLVLLFSCGTALNEAEKTTDNIPANEIPPVEAVATPVAWKDVTAQNETVENLLNPKDLEVAKAILNSLVAENDLTGTPPKLVVKKMGKDSIAFCTSNTITLNTELIQLCRTKFPKEQNFKTALAIVIGHELHHYYQDSKNCIYGFADHNTPWRVKKEHDADLGGLYYAAVAGYTKVRSTAPALLEHIYQHFNLKPQLKGYKSLEERKQAYTELAAKADTLSRFFVLGNVMMGMRQFDMAEEAFGHILRRGYKVKEVRLHEILASLYDYIYPNGNQIKGEFIFPLELELTIGMNAIEPIGKDRSTEDKEKLKSIIERLDALQQEYPNYSKVQFYLAVCHALAGNTQKLMPLKNSLSPSYREKMELIQALATLKQNSGDTKAKATLARMSSQAGDANLQKLAAWNLQVLDRRFPYEGNKAVEPCPFKVGNSGYTRKYGQNAAGIEWEEKEGEVVYGFWLQRGRRDSYRKIAVSSSIKEGLISIGSNSWIYPGCSSILFTLEGDTVYKWEYK